VRPRPAISGKRAVDKHSPIAVAVINAIRFILIPPHSLSRDLAVRRVDQESISEFAVRTDNPDACCVDATILEDYYETVTKV
jgi:hypothetical protein